MCHDASYIGVAVLLGSRQVCKCEEMSLCIYVMSVHVQKECNDIICMRKLRKTRKKLYLSQIK